MVNLASVRDLFLPSMYVARDDYMDRHGTPVAPLWDVGIVHAPVPGVTLVVTHTDGATLQSLISEQDIERAMEASLEWRYRLVGGPKAWRARPLWKWRDKTALASLLRRHIKEVFP